MVDTQNLVGQGMGIAMDQIWRSLFGDAGANLKAGKPVTGADVANSAFTVGLNALPFGAGGGAVRGAQAAARATQPSADLARAYNQLARTLAKPKVTHMTTMQGLEGMVGSGGRMKTAFGDAVSPSPASTGDFTVRGVVAADDPVYGAFMRGNPNVTYLPSSAPAYATKTTQDAQRATRLMQGVPDNPMLQYGDIGINFSPQVSRASTATVGDSVGWAPTVARADGGASFAPTPRLSPGASAQQIREAAEAAGAGNLRSPWMNRSLPYLEAQIPKELATLQNAKSISVSSKAQADSVKKLLESAGINTKVVVRKTKTESQSPINRAIEALDKASKRMEYRRSAVQEKLRQARNSDRRQMTEPEA